MLYQGVKGVTDLMVRPGIINLDFADVRSVMNEMGKAMMGTGEATGEDRAVQAAEKAIANPLLDEISLKGAKGVLINITAGPDLTLFELDEAANRIRAEVDPEANIMVGSTLDPEMAGLMRVSVVATGIDAAARSEAMPLPSAASPSRSPRPRRAPARRAGPRAAAGAAAEPVARAELRRPPASPRPSAPSSSPSREPPAVPQPAALERTAPYGQPKFERRRAAPAGRALARRAAPAAGGGAERAEGPADGPPGRAAAAARGRAAQPADDQQPDPQDDRPGRPRAGAPLRPRPPSPSSSRARPSSPTPATRKPSANASTSRPSSGGRPTDGGRPTPP